MYVWNNKDTIGDNVTVNQDTSTANELVALSEGNNYIVNSGAPTDYTPYTYPYPSRGISSTSTCLVDPSETKAATGINFWNTVNTSITAPSVTTVSPPSVSTSTLTLNGSITSDGGASSTLRGFAWGTNSSLTGGDTATTTESGTFGTGSFTANLANLTPNTTYYFRAYAVNSQGTSTGSILSTTTLATVSTSTPVNTPNQTNTTTSVSSSGGSVSASTLASILAPGTTTTAYLKSIGYTVTPPPITIPTPKPVTYPSNHPTTATPQPEPSNPISNPVVPTTTTTTYTPPSIPETATTTPIQHTSFISYVFNAIASFFRWVVGR